MSPEEVRQNVEMAGGAIAYVMRQVEMGARGRARARARGGNGFNVSVVVLGCELYNLFVKQVQEMSPASYVSEIMYSTPPPFNVPTGDYMVFRGRWIFKTYSNEHAVIAI